MIVSSVVLLAELRVTHLDRSYFVTMGTYQMAVLLQFNDHEQLTLGELEEATKLNIKELEKQALSLIDAKFLLGDTVERLEKSALAKSLEGFSSRMSWPKIRWFRSISTTKASEQNLKFRWFLRKKLVMWVNGRSLQL